MPAIAKRELIFAAIEKNLKRIKTASGFATDVKLVERQHDIRRTEELPCIFINDGGEEYEYMPTRRVRDHIVYVVTGAMSVDENDPNESSSLHTLLNAFIKDVKDCIAQDEFLATAHGSRLLVQHKIEAIYR